MFTQILVYPNSMTFISIFDCNFNSVKIDEVLICVEYFGNNSQMFDLYPADCSWFVSNDKLYEERRNKITSQ